MNPFLKLHSDIFFRDNKEFIVAAFRRGDNSNFKGIYDNLSFPLTSYAKKITNSPLDAQDIAANGFFKLLLAREKMTSYKYVTCWMYITVRNESIDHIRSQARQKKAMEEWYYLSDYSQDAINSEKLKASLLRIVYKAIEKLPTQRRTILCLYFFEKKTTREIAAMLQLSPQTVLNHKAKALESLRKTLPLPD